MDDFLGIFLLEKSVGAFLDELAINYKLKIKIMTYIIKFFFKSQKENWQI